MGSDPFRQLRALMILGRVSNLPTVWSNCFAGWWLGGDGNVARLPFLFAGVTLLYLGGMFLNDAFDVEFDRQHRKERPIPSGAISLRAVWRLGWVWLIGGLVLLFFCGNIPGVLGLILALCIVLYDAIHKAITFSPVLMGICRFFVYVIAAACGANGISGWAIWCGLALAAYVTGLSFLARVESTRGPAHYWPALLLGLPVALAMLVNVGAYREPALWLSLVLTLWVVRCLRTSFWTNNLNVGRTVSGLLAGIVLVDWLTVAPWLVVSGELPREMGCVFLALFLSALLGQRFVPAT